MWRLASLKFAMNSHHLTSVPNCPICGSAERTYPTGEIMLTEPDSYSLRLAEFLGVTVNDMFRDVRQCVCENCGTVYLDPHFTNDSQTLLFQVVSPTHISGWTQWEIGTRTGRGQPHLLHLSEHLEAIFGPCNRYVEVACPFSGMLLATVEASALTSWQSSESPTARVDSRMTVMARMYAHIERLVLRAFDFLLALRRWTSRVEVQTTGAERPLSRKRTLALVPSLSRWNIGCQRYGWHCSQVAIQALECEIVYLEDLEADSADIVGVFNSLDHLPHPLEILRKCLKIAPVVVISGHRPSHTKYQHGFAINSEVLKSLGRRNSFAVSDISDLIPDWPRSEFLAVLTRN